MIDKLGTDAAQQWARGSMQAHGMAEFWPDGDSVACQLRRLRCARWWRRVLRGVLAKDTEQCAIQLGFVSKDRDIYCSNEAVQRDRGMRANSARVLEQTYLENELGQQVPIAELAAKSTANRNIRLAELMTRISGMDMIAQETGHEGLFVTVTCPSRMHPCTTVGGRVRPNPSFDGTTPQQAHRYLCRQWNKLGAALARAGVQRYGFRVVEPHHDGCPHWHVLIFYPEESSRGAVSRAVLRSLFRRYFLLNDSPDERGAEVRRVKFMPIDRSKGTAASYIAKYISKNTTGFKLETDLYGEPIMSTIERVQAWASTWRIRQFQQIGGAPIGVWRELRRVNPESVDGAPLPDALGKALSAVNIGQIGGRVAVGFQLYTQAQGGPCVRRRALAIRLLKQETGEVNRYGEVRAPDVIGVEAQGVNLHKPAHMVAMLGKLAPTVARPASARIESERCQWRHITSAHIKTEGTQAQREALRPWTRVNNSTRTHWTDGSTGRDVAIVSRSKTGRFRGWSGSPGDGEGRGGGFSQPPTPGRSAP